MLGIKYHFTGFFRSYAHTVGNHRNVFIEFDLERLLDMEIPGLADHADGTDLSIEQCRQAGIILGTAAGPAGHAKSGELGTLEFWRVGKKRIIGRICARPAAFDIIEARIIQQPCDEGLVGRVKVNTLGLRAIAPRGIKYIYAILVW